MTTPYNPRTPINELHDMIDKHVPQAEAKLQAFYDKAHETRALPKRAVLAEDKTTGKKLLAPKKKAKYGDGRDDYSAIGRRYLKHLALVQARRKAIAKAKKKGGRRA